MPRGKRILLTLLTGVVGVCFTLLAARRVLREIRYSRTVRSYSAVVKPGMTRSQVDSYLRARDPNVELGKICCFAAGDAPADLLRIATENRSWPCIERDIYVAFEFQEDSPRPGLVSNPNDRLKQVFLFRSVCLDMS
jgi:hypothetical protein